MSKIEQARELADCENMVQPEETLKLAKLFALSETPARSDVALANALLAIVDLRAERERVDGGEPFASEDPFLEAIGQAIDGELGWNNQEDEERGDYPARIREVAAELDGLKAQLSTAQAKLAEVEGERDAAHRDLGKLAGRPGKLETVHGRQAELAYRELLSRIAGLESALESVRTMAGDLSASRADWMKRAELAAGKLAASESALKVAADTKRQLDEAREQLRVYGPRAKADDDDETLTEVDHLNPWKNGWKKHPNPTEQPAKFIQGVRYYLGMLEDDGNWSHELGHIQEYCAEFEAAIEARRLAHAKPKAPPPESATAATRAILVGSVWKGPLRHSVVTQVNGAMTVTVRPVNQPEDGMATHWDRADFLAKNTHVSDPAQPASGESEL